MKLMRYILAVFIAAVVVTMPASLALPEKSKNNNKSLKTSVSFLGKIKHIIVLMLENRSFDHFFGFSKPDLNVNGLSGKEFNYEDVKDKESKKVFVSNNAPYINECDPDHSTPATKEKVANNMGGFVSFENAKGHKNKNYCDVMRTFTPEKLPVLTTLAKEFAIMDEFFCSHPGPTWPNRMFCLSGTSAGSTETGTWYHNKVGSLFPQRTIFDQVSEAGLKWRNYYNDTPWELFMESIAHSPHNVKNLESFFDDAKNGNLPNYAWINPRSGVNMTTGLGSQDQHPDHDVALGESYIKDIYEALRASPQWNNTLLVLTYDEHGGFFDHVEPPQNISGPNDNEKSYPDAGYDFTKLGVRVPTILVSPYIPKGTVISEPPMDQKPFENSKYDLTSIMSTARKLLSMPNQNLTGRDGWSATFEHIFERLEVPRNDCPLHLPAAPKPSLSHLEEGALPLNDLQKDIATVHSHVLAMYNDEEHQDIEDMLRNMKQRDVSAFLQGIYKEHETKTINWKRSKAAKDYNIVCQPSLDKTFVEKSFVVNSNASYQYNTISTMSLRSGQNVPYCLDSGISTGLGIRVSECYPSHLVNLNRDADQHWIVNNDASIRSMQNQSLCVTNLDPNINNGSTKLALEICDGRVEQHYAYHTSPRDGIVPGEFYYGDDTNIIGIV